MGKDAQRLAFVVFSFQRGDKILGFGRVSEHEDRSFLDGPVEMVVADLFIAVTGPLAIGLFCRPDQPGI